MRRASRYGCIPVLEKEEVESNEDNISEFNIIKDKEYFHNHK